MAVYQVTAENAKIMGRRLFHENVLYLSFSAGYVEFETETDFGSVEIVSDPELFEDDMRSVVAIYLNDSPEPVVRRQLHKNSQKITFWESDCPKKIKVRIQRLTEVAFSNVGIAGIELGKDHLGAESVMSATPGKKCKIEFIGDSITCGYGVEGNETHAFNTWEENPMKAYAVMAAEWMDADYQLVTRSGIGMISCYVPPEAELPDETLLMKELYPTQDIMMFQRNGWSEAGAPADYAAFAADIVVLNIGTNDASYARENEDRQAEFGKAYRKFAETVLRANPRARLVCTLGVLDQRLCRKVEEQVRLLAAENPEREISFLWMDLQKPEDGVGSDFHPSYVTQKKMAQSLASYLGYGRRINEYSDGTT